MPRQIEQLVIQQIRQAELAGNRVSETGLPGRSIIITISRSMGSGARIIAEKLAADLGWSFWSKELLDFMGEDGNISRRVVEEFDEKAHSELETLVDSLLGDKEMGDFIYVRHLAAALKYIQRHGCAVILGRGANFILPDALRIRIDASMEKRIRNMVTFEGMTKESALEKLRRSDRDRQHFIHKTFGKREPSPCSYDLYICMDSFTNDDAVSLIKSALKMKFHLNSA